VYALNLQHLRTDIANVSRGVTEQKGCNDGAKQDAADLREMVARMGPVLRPLATSTGLDSAHGILDNLGACLGQAKHIYNKYQEGWNKWKFWVTPSKIQEKTRRTKDQLLQAYQELLVALGVANHINWEAREKMPHIRNPFEESRKTWEIASSQVKICQPKVMLGHGSFGVVVLAKFQGEEVTFF